MPKLGKFLHFDNFFSDLADFQDLDNFLLFDFLNFLTISSPLSTPNPSTLLILASSYSEIDLSGSIVVFSIEVNGAAILPKP